MRKLNIDHYFTIGTSHSRKGRPCEDYAISGELDDGRVYGIVCDGCGGVYARTDVGARILALSTEALLKDTPSLGECFSPAFVETLCQRLQARPLGGVTEDHFASMVAFCADQDAATIYIAGDGGFATVDKAGLSATLTILEWPHNEPYYLGNCLDQDIVSKRSTEFLTNGSAVTFTTCTEQLGRRPSASTGGPVPRRTETPCIDLLQGWRQTISLKEIWKLAVFTDGLAQVDDLDIIEAATQLLDFKSLNGNYVALRASALLSEWMINGSLPRDDLAISVMTAE